jgi:membrane-bound lytic murein transglycosylase B
MPSRSLLVAAAAFASTVLSLPSAALADFSSCLGGLRSAAAAKGVSGSTFDRATRGLEPDMKVIELMNNQPEFKTPIWDYLATLVDEEKVAEGQAMLRRHAATLAGRREPLRCRPAHDRGGLGVESDFGKSAARCRSSRRWRPAPASRPPTRLLPDELVSTLRIIERWRPSTHGPEGSWAGAFGHTQVHPSTYLRLAVTATATAGATS